MYGTWLQGIRQDLKYLVLLGAAATCWAMWLCRNAMVFEKQINVIFVGYFLNFALAPLVGYSLEDRFAGYGCSSLTVPGEGGQGVFYPGTWVAV